MRERHNIAGTEVGRPRPPFYTRSGAKLQVRGRRVRKLLIITTLLLAGSLGLGFAMFA
jgi:hypothetical protein